MRDVWCIEPRPEADGHLRCSGPRFCLSFWLGRACVLGLRHSLLFVCWAAPVQRAPGLLFFSV